MSMNKPMDLIDFLVSGNEETPEEIISLCLSNGFRLILCEDIGKYLPVEPELIERFSSFTHMSEHDGHHDVIVYLKPSALAGI